MYRLLAIGLVWLGCALAWAVLGSTLVHRSGELSSELGLEVERLWGPPLAQRPPVARPVPQPEGTASEAAGGSGSGPATQPAPRMAPVASRVTVRIEHEQRRKGLLWFPTYAAAFTARYTFANEGAEARDLVISFPLPARNVVYDGFAVTAEGGAAVAVEVADAAVWRAHFAPGERRAYEVTYRARGTGRWSYLPADGAAKVDDLSVVVETDFAAVDFPAGSLAPTGHERSGGGWRGTWTFTSLIGGGPIAVDLPRKLDPGPLAARITFFAPVGLLFFFFVVGVLGAAHSGERGGRARGIHPMNYFLVGCAYFAFHLLFAYLVDHVPVGPAFAASAAVSVGLVVSYARLFVGWRFALLHMGVAQLVFLVLFSLTFFWRGLTGLTVTAGAIGTLALVMQLTGRTDWAERLARRREPRPAADPREPRPTADPLRRPV